MSTAVWTGDLADMTLFVEVAWGADLTDTAGSGWTWTDVTGDVRQTPGISTRLGRGDEASRSQPASLSLVLDNTTGNYSRGGQSSLYPYVRRGTPVRVRINPNDGAGPRVVFFGYADGFTPGWDALGEVPTTTLAASGALRRLQQGATPVISPFTRAKSTNTTLVAYWPMEENQGATVVTSGLSNGYDMVFNGAPVFGAHTEFYGTARAADAGTTGAFQAVVRPYTVTAAVGQQLRWFASFPDAGTLADGTVLAHCHLTGTLGRIDITYELTPGPVIGVFRYNSDGTLNGSDLWNLAVVGLDATAGRMSLEVRQNGANVEWNVGWLPQEPGSSLANTGFQSVAGKTCGIIQFVEMVPHGGAQGYGLGQITVENTITNQFTDRHPQRAFYGEFATNVSGRAFRVCTENGVPFQRFVDSDPFEPTIPAREVMSFQPVTTLLDILYECEDSDVAQLWDGRQVGLVFTTRRYRESGVVALTLDASAGQLAPPFEAVDDDQRTTNSVTAQRKFGSSATYTDSTSPMGTAAIGRYDSSVTINLAADSMMLQEAAFRVALGTVGGYRTPTLSIDLRAVPSLAPAVLALIPGDRVQVLLPATALTSFPEDTLDLLVEGIAHQVDAAGWTCKLTCSPAGPWIAARAAAVSGDTGENVLRADTSGSTLAASAPRNATTLSVSTPSGPLWTTVADNFPLNLDVGGIKVVATACSGSSSPQTFTISPLRLDRASGSAVKLWDQRGLAL